MSAPGRKHALALVGVVLAAGRGERMGGPKALLMDNEGPLVAEHVRRMHAVGCQRVVVAVPQLLLTCVQALFVPTLARGSVDVLGVSTASPAESLRAVCAHLQGSTQCNPDARAEGQGASVLAAAGHASRAFTAPPLDASQFWGLLVTHVDRLPVRKTTLRALIAALAHTDVDVATPMHAGLSGHPIALRTRCLRHPYDNLRALVRSACVQRRYVDVDDAAVLENLNDAAAYERVFATLPRFAKVDGGRPNRRIRV